MRNLQRELIRAKEVKRFDIHCYYLMNYRISLDIIQELKRIQSVPLIIGQFNEMIDTNYGVVNSTAGSTFYVRILRYLSLFSILYVSSRVLTIHSRFIVL